MRDPQSGQALRVLVIDGEDERRRRVVSTLEKSPDGPLAILAVRRPEEVIPRPRRTFDVALLSLDPGDDPLARVADLRRTFPEVPVVTLDGDPVTEDAQAFVRAGVQDHLPACCAHCRNRIRLWSTLRWAVERSRLLRRLEALQRENAYRGLHDPLTDLPNRDLFHDRLQQARALARRNGTSFALLFVDLDGFKQVNDSLGHAIGDQLLVEVARRLSATLRASDTCARWGGDEFCLLVTGIERRADAARVAQKLLQALGEPIRLDGNELRCRASIGLSLYPEDGEDEEALLRAADSAMYRAKAAGGGSYRFFRKGGRRRQELRR